MAQPSTNELYDKLFVNDILQDLDYYAPESGVWLGGRSKNLGAWQFVKGNGGKEFITQITNSNRGLCFVPIFL